MTRAGADWKPSIPIDEIRLLCATLWNPIGFPIVGGPNAEHDTAPMPADEYDAYLRKVLEMAEQGGPAAELVAYLARAERDTMGLPAPSGDKNAFVAALFQRCARS